MFWYNFLFFRILVYYAKVETILLKKISNIISDVIYKGYAVNGCFLLNEYFVCLSKLKRGWYIGCSILIKGMDHQKKKILYYSPERKTF